jgi:hypothetical protein
MLDKATYTDHRMNAAMQTDQGSHRGWNFDRAVDESPLWLRALAETFRPRSLVILAVIAGVVSLFWIV